MDTGGPAAHFAAMTYKFTATRAKVVNDEDALTVGIADDTTEPRKQLILQLAHEFDHQDRELGMDCVWIEIEDDTRSNYGDVRAITVKNNKLTVELGPDAAFNMKIKGKIEIALPESQDDIEKAIAGIAEIAARDGIPFQKG